MMERAGLHGGPRGCRQRPDWDGAGGCVIDVADTQPTLALGEPMRSRFPHAEFPLPTGA